MVWSRDGPGVGPVAVYARVAYSCTYGAGLRPLGVSSAHRPSFSGHTLLCVPHIELCRIIFVKPAVQVVQKNLPHDNSSLGVSSRVVTHKVYRVETTLHASRLELHSTDHLTHARGAESS